MRFKITPQNRSFYGLFTESAEHILEGAKVLRAGLETPPGEREEAATRLKDLEHDGDSATHRILSAVNSSFITPFDREDIYDLASRLDDCLDHMEAAISIAVLYRVGEVPPELLTTADVLIKMAELTLEAMPGLEKMHGLKEYWIAINSLENEADQHYRHMIAALFENNHDAVEIIRLKALYDEVEAAADSFETVANTIESIAAKES